VTLSAWSAAGTAPLDAARRAVATEGRRPGAATIMLQVPANDSTVARGVEALADGSTAI
jgi:hypothetical protein